MTTFADFIVELRASDPSLDLSPLESAFDSISTEDDLLSIALFDAIAWAIARTRYSPQIRLAFIAACYDRALPDRQLLQ